jgi:hypothetical protein
VASTNIFRVWISAVASDHPLVRQSKFHQDHQRPSSTSAQKALFFLTKTGMGFYLSELKMGLSRSDP